MSKEKLLIIIGGPEGCGKSLIYEALRSRKNSLPLGGPGAHGALESPLFARDPNFKRKG